MPKKRVEIECDETIPSITSNVAQEWFDGLITGKAKTVVTSEGSRFSFVNKQGRHYLEYVDSTRREPNGRFKRVYKGKIINDETVEYHKERRDLEASNEYAKWKLTTYARKGRDEAGGSNERPTGEAERREALLVLDDRTRDTRATYLQ